ncbi:hypothetical protein KR51_00031460 [Rubidibacter lacunae KORDI 51-2]|uniref:Alpha-amylase n=1 Tax=Rubidibacter lacunae KORDI 51-2 TaxID=582515 RepID=U5DG19_9CHRO|nr:glucosylglycerol hydrolase [Rubidibacter lacunae]ERN40207.1 hypothetical protein KR51_00031460 [Rubidibacter lacunae KORDI 51-2]
MVAEATQPNIISLVEDETDRFEGWGLAIENADLETMTYFEKGQAYARRLGAHYRSDGLTEVGFWTPELTGEVLRPRAIYLEVFTPLETVNLRFEAQTIRVRRDRLSLRQRGEFFFGVVSGLQAGTRDRLGSLYWLRYVDPQEQLQIVRDPVAYSLPFGIFGPAEVYDVERLQSQRADLEYFRRTGVAVSKSAANGEAAEPQTEKGNPVAAAGASAASIPRVPAPRNILQIHIGTSAEDRSFEGLTQLYRQIAEKIAADRPLTPFEENFVGYDAIQFLPVEPTIEYRDDYSPISEFFDYADPDTELPSNSALPLSDEVQLSIKDPATCDWGYDVPILGSSAFSPDLLAGLRPDEAIDLIAELHNFPEGPIQVIYDLVYGHADNQAELLINRQFLKGPNMYGQDLNHQLPTVRAIFLEMQRRKLNSGADGIRVDGGQDFRFFNPLSGRVEQDDAYLLAMSDVVQEIGGYQRLMFTIFEDGRPWPTEGWEETSTYRDLIELRPDAYQWGPLIFAHNTPALQGFWERKWRRVCEVMSMGDRWITGCANHDTVRRGNQIDPHAQIDWNLGNTLQEVLQNAYDNPATTLWVYGFSPGLPMDFINALVRAPWMFFRNTDERYGVKVVSEEVGFLDWQVTPEIYARSHSFPRLKSLGFETLEQVREFGKALQIAMLERDYDLNAVVEACHSCLGEATDRCEFPLLQRLNRPGMVSFLNGLDIPKLKHFALMFMEDCFELCNIWHYRDNLEARQTAFNLGLRHFRRARPWLSDNLTGRDRFNKISEDGRMVFYGIRARPDEQQVAMVAHMGGAPLTVTLGDWLQLDIGEWELAIATPGLEVNNLAHFELGHSQGVLLVRSA